MSVGKRIKKYLQQNNINQNWVSKKINITSSKLDKVLNGKRKLTVEEFEKIIVALNVEANTFIKP